MRKKKQNKTEVKLNFSRGIYLKENNHERREKRSRVIAE